MLGNLRRRATKHQPFMGRRLTPLLPASAVALLHAVLSMPHAFSWHAARPSSRCDVDSKLFALKIVYGEAPHPSLFHCEATLRTLHALFRVQSVNTVRVKYYTSLNSLLPFPLLRSPPQFVCLLLASSLLAGSSLERLALVLNCAAWLKATHEHMQPCRRYSALTPLHTAAKL